MGASGATLLGCDSGENARAKKPVASPEAVQRDLIQAIEPLQSPWQTQDPFLFCVHHNDRYPRGNDQLGPAASLAGRQMGRDFAGIDGWRMYHGSVVPGFPRHPHRGFETVTVVRHGLVDHSDSLGATARYGAGDVQWMTAGQGIVHAEMFPLLHRAEPNPIDFFQIWLNLPAANKMVEAHFSMLWAPTVPVRVVKDKAGQSSKVMVVAGAFDGATPGNPPPKSWAAERDSHVAIWSMTMEPGARLTLPAAPTGAKRSLYYFAGEGLQVAGVSVPGRRHIRVRGDSDLALRAGPTGAELLLLQGKPIGEPVARRGPFVMNSQQEIMQAYSDYRRTRFGGWPWPSDEHVHAAQEGRFALRPGGTLERPPA